MHISSSLLQDLQDGVLVVETHFFDLLQLLGILFARWPSISRRHLATTWWSAHHSLQLCHLGRCHTATCSSSAAHHWVVAHSSHAGKWVWLLLLLLCSSRLCPGTYTTSAHSCWHATHCTSGSWTARLALHLVHHIHCIVHILRTHHLSHSFWII